MTDASHESPQPMTDHYSDPEDAPSLTDNRPASDSSNGPAISTNGSSESTNGAGESTNSSAEASNGADEPTESNDAQTNQKKVVRLNDRLFTSLIDESIAVGVVGVGNMGRHHARVYTELPGTKLVGVSDVDSEQATAVAEQYGTAVVPLDRLLGMVDAVSIAVPDTYHYDIARKALDAGVHVLVEKPFVVDPEEGVDLIRRADEAGLVLQVGHIERFNPAVQTLADVLDDCSILAIEASRLGPPLDREGTENPVLDLMIHDLDVVCSILDSDVESVQASAAADGAHMTALLTFESGQTATLTASRVTQRKVRTLAVTAHECRVDVDYIDQSVEIHRQSIPELVAVDGDVRYRHEGIIERPMVDRGEPLKNELQAFVDAVRQGTPPIVSGEDGLRALRLANAVEEAAGAESAVREVRK